MAGWADGYTSELPYLYLHIAEQSPQVIDFSLVRAGITPPARREGATYLELGCGYGFSSNIFAACYPDMVFHAVDINPSHIAAAQELAEDAELANITFHDLSFAEFLERDTPRFDYITLHGVWSWVNTDVRDQIVEIISKKLRTGGAVYVSYNALPGKAATLPLQKLYSELYSALPGSEYQRIAQTMNLMDGFMELQPKYFEKNPLVAEQHGRMKTMQPNYFAHEFLNEAWHADFFVNVCRDLLPARATYAASADFLGQMALAAFEQKYADVLDRIPHPLLAEQLKDYVVNTSFRADIFVRGPRKLEGLDLVQRLHGLTLALLAPPDTLTPDIENKNRSVRLNEEPHAAVVAALASNPQTIGSLAQQADLSRLPFSNLLDMICCMVAGGQIAILRDEAEVSDTGPAERLNAAIMQRTKAGGEYDWLAAPDIGYGIHCDRMERIFLQALREGADPATEAAKTCALINQPLFKDGKTVEDPEETIALLKQAASEFKKTRFKYLDRVKSAA